MKFLFAEFRSPGDPPDVLRGQWVIPAPHLENVFVDVVKGEICIGAIVRDGDILGFDPDLMLDALCVLYPGLPKDLLKHYVIQTAVALNSGLEQPKVGDRFRVFCDQTKATLQDTGTQRMLPLWDNFETEKFL